ncbi:MAG: hypothetical protein J0H15_11000 [Xanthomonadales bacterium]|nr:hypothetical protein [Xanthomonadales bacterium]
MNTHSLSATYRHLCSRRKALPTGSAELASALAGERGATPAALEALAGEPGMAELAALLRELAPASASLAGEVSRLQRAHPQRSRRGAAHPQRRHHGHGARQRWLGGIAACLAVAFGLVMTTRPVDDAGPWQDVAATSSSVAQAGHILASREDVIFAASGEAPARHAPARHQQAPDTLFRGTFALGG